MVILSEQCQEQIKAFVIYPESFSS